MTTGSESDKPAATAPTLDYAGPQTPSDPFQSTYREFDGGCSFTFPPIKAWRAGIELGVAACVFAFLVLCVCITIHGFVRYKESGFLSTTLFAAILGIGVLALSIARFRSTWIPTVLVVSGENLTLKTPGIFRPWIRTWPTTRIRYVRAHRHGLDVHLQQMGWLDISTRMFFPVRLAFNYKFVEVNYIAAVVRHRLGLLNT